MQGVGIGCLLCIAAIAIGIIAASIVPNLSRIWDTACGRPWAPRLHLAARAEWGGWRGDALSKSDGDYDEVNGNIVFVQAMGFAIEVGVGKIRS